MSGSLPRRRNGAARARFYFVLIAVTLFSLGNSSDMFLVLRAQNVGIRVALAPLLGLVFNITYTLASWPAGWFSDRVSRRLVASAGYVIFAAVYFVFGRAPSTLAIWIAMAIYGFYYALTQPVLKALVVETVGERVRGRALGIYFFVTSVATLACEPDHWRIVEALWRSDSVLLFGGDGADRGGNFAGCKRRFEHNRGYEVSTVTTGIRASALAG